MVTVTRRLGAGEDRFSARVRLSGRENELCAISLIGKQVRWDIRPAKLLKNHESRAGRILVFAKPSLQKFRSAGFTRHLVVEEDAPWKQFTLSHIPLL
jgi:hypothetical protein